MVTDALSMYVDTLRRDVVQARRRDGLPRLRRRRHQLARLHFTAVMFLGWRRFELAGLANAAQEFIEIY